MPPDGGRIWTKQSRRASLLSYMPLEDHIGDICRKARVQSGTPTAKAAHAAGVSEVVLEQFESEGVCRVPLDVGALARELGLDEAASQRVALGWEPPAVDVRRWRELRMLTTREGFEVNSFVAWDPATRECALFDTGWNARSFFTLVAEHQLIPRHLFITHTHGDHVAALGEVRREFPDISLHSNSRHAPAMQRVTHGQRIKLGGLTVESRWTPGHAEDGVSYVLEGWPQGAPSVAVVGDAIFAGSMGKDFQTPAKAMGAVREQILTLPGDTLICPGHGPLTTVAGELCNNPFFAGAGFAVDPARRDC